MKTEMISFIMMIAGGENKKGRGEGGGVKTLQMNRRKTLRKKFFFILGKQEMTRIYRILRSRCLLMRIRHKTRKRAIRKA